MKRSLLILWLLLSSFSLQSQLNGKIKIYFTHPVNTSVFSGITAEYLNSAMDDTLVAYIGRAKYSLDIAVYNYQQSTGMADIAAAVNNAQANGVVVRWIYDGGQSNSGMSTLNSNVNTLGSPTGGAYGIMHNKFMIIDAGSANPNDPIVWTGSTNWTKTHFNSNVNNTVIIQDQSLALAYLQEFNEMWGDTGAAPNLVNSKFGPFKSDNTSHSFVIGSGVVELYFSPTDSVNSKTLSVISSANSDLYFGMLAFSSTTNSNAVIAKKNAGINVSGVVDQSSSFYTPYGPLSSSLGSQLQTYSQFTSVYHNKILIADACNVLSDPAVITGSYNWTTPAETVNDENMLIIHDSTVANIFYQSFYQNFTDLGGTSPLCTVTTIGSESPNMFFELYPTVNSGCFSISWSQPSSQTIDISLVSLNGQSSFPLFQSNGVAGPNSCVVNRSDLAPGIYFVLLTTGDMRLTRKIVVFPH